MASSEVTGKICANLSAARRAAQTNSVCAAEDLTLLLIRESMEVREHSQIVDLGPREFCTTECGVWPEFIRAPGSDEPARSSSARRAFNLKSTVGDGLASLRERRFQFAGGLDRSFL